ncbi:MAG TPA: cobyric acid synthase [Polyangia bacterium]|jgi:adenosylcobyric acid synthase|nr:cobyric acid synthase [Polyangia bacterium]
MIARTLMVQGTASAAGKTLLVAALCRLFRRAGLRVAPFKSQNMALNAFVTPDGGEIGRAQAVQAEAAGAALSVDMNPILLKPEGSARCQVIVMGKSVGSLTAAQYHDKKGELAGVIAASLGRLREAHDVVVIEGAGSPAEINLKDRELVNMHVARLADAPVLLVGDIDRGGVFASLVGTMELLERHERARIAGFVINKFRGDLSLLTPGLETLTGRTGVPVLGVVPFIDDLRLPDEDGVSLDDRDRGRDRTSGSVAVASGARDLAVVVVRFPRLANHDELQPLEYEPGVRLRYVDRPEEIAAADLVILPGSKSTMADLAWLRERGLGQALAARIERGGPVLGICGGCQMLGETIEDPGGVESAIPHVAGGLGFLPLRTRFQADKIVAQVKASPSAGSFLTGGLPPGTTLTGYEIHAGVAERSAGAPAPFRLSARNGQAVDLPDGAVGAGGVVVGTLIHGLLENAAVRSSLLASLRARRGDPTPPPSPAAAPGDVYDRLADVVRDSLDWPLVRRITGLA